MPHEKPGEAVVPKVMAVGLASTAKVMWTKVPAVNGPALGLTAVMTGAAT